MNDESLFGPSEKEQAQKKIFISTFSMLAKLTDVDGEVDRTEVVAVDQFMRKVLNLDEQRRQFAGKIFNEARRSKLSFRDYALQYRDMLQGQPRMLEWMIDLLLRVSMADSVFTDNEEKLIRNACSIFSITEQRYQQLRARHVPPGADLNYAVLGCKPSSAISSVC